MYVLGFQIWFHKFDRLFSDDIQKDVDDKTNSEVGELKPGNYAKLQLKQKHFDCKLLFQSKVHDLPAPTFMSKPFKVIPDLLKADYLYDRRIKEKEWYIEENFPTNRTSSTYILYFKHFLKWRSLLKYFKDNLSYLSNYISPTFIN